MYNSSEDEKKNDDYFKEKFDKGKPCAGVLLDFGLALLEVAKIGTFGIEKYARGSWSHIPDARIRYTDAMMRHLLISQYEEIDPDSKILHEAHMAWNTLARLELLLREQKEAEMSAGTKTQKEYVKRSKK